MKRFLLLSAVVAVSAFARAADHPKRPAASKEFEMMKGLGAQHEMTNVYHDVDGKLMTTHYCAMGNAPQMKVTCSDAKSIAFEAVKANGIGPKTSPHMHSLAYTWTDKDHLSAAWKSANMGTEHEAPPVFSYTRVEDAKPPM